MDLDAAQKRGIGVRNVTAYSSEDIAEYVIMGTLFLVRRLPLFLKHNEKSPWGVRAIPPYRTAFQVLPSPLRDRVILGAGQP